MRDKLLKRFFSYVGFDTQSRENVNDRFPSTESQKKLSKVLVNELRSLGIEDAVMDKYGYVTATLPGNLPESELARVPVIGFFAHIDTSPEVSGRDVVPILHENYRGGDIVLPADKSSVIRVDENPELENNIGNDIVTSDGSTLLGADDKAGIAEIMTMVEYFIDHPEIKRGSVKVAFTVDEEVGNGLKYFDLRRFGADFGYTVDGGKMGEIENETFNGSVAEYKIRGRSVHPGYAKGKMVNSVRVAADIVKELEDEPSPETTEKREGYLHPYYITGGVSEARLRVLIRDFEADKMMEKEERLKSIRREMLRRYHGAEIDLKIDETYRNMKAKLDEDSRVVEYALEAVRRSGIEPELKYIRGGTDGAWLCYNGLLAPNIFTGGMNFHSRLEWIPVQAMIKSVETLINIVLIWSEKSLLQ